MPEEIKAIRQSLPYRLGTVNCYLVKNGNDGILIDAGCANGRADLERELERAGCKASNLRLIAITHGDFDHIGNAAYLRRTFGAKIAMHDADSGMAERGDMFWNRKAGNRLIRMMAPLLFRFRKSDRFKPDTSIGDGFDLCGYGIEAKTVYLPGHSKGSIGILTANGALFCGDLLDNIARPGLNSIMDDLAAAEASVEKLASLKIDIVYPGHGRPFSMELFRQNSRQDN